MNSYEYIIVFWIVEKPVLELKIKHISSVHSCGAKQLCGAWNSI